MTGSPKVFCSVCGHKMRFSRVKQRRVIYYCFTCKKERRLHPPQEDSCDMTEPV